LLKLLQCCKSDALFFPFLFPKEVAWTVNLGA
jgi:hypothetical protein